VTVWSAFFVPINFSASVASFFSQSGLLVRPHRARMTDSLLGVLVFLKCNSCLIWDTDLMLTYSWNNCVVLFVNNAKLAFHDLLSAWVELSIGSVIGFMTRSLGLGLWSGALALQPLALALWSGVLALAWCLQALLTTLIKYSQYF